MKRRRKLLSFRLDEQDWQLLREASFHSGMKIQAILTEAVQHWLLRRMVAGQFGDSVSADVVDGKKN